jgi:hypothetical protein
MTFCIHAASAPIFSRLLGNLVHWLEKAQAHAQAKGFDSANYMALRLAPDMLPFASQVKIAGDIARMAMCRLSGAETPKWPDEENTLETLIVRVRKAIEAVHAVRASDVQGVEAKPVVLPQRGGEPLQFTGESFLQQWALPSFFFHVTTAYALLRHAGVDLGKADYLGLD